MPTDLKNYESALDSMKKNVDKIQLLDDCYKSQSPFNANASCYKLDGTDWKRYSDNSYVNYQNSAKTTLPTLPRTGTAHANLNDLSGVSYKDIFNNLAVDNYNGNSAFYSEFTQDITDLSGALHRAGDFHNDLKNKYQAINDLRSELDNKMRDIYNPEEQDSYRLHDQSIYMTLSWTILATSVLYYLFVKL